MLRHLFATRAGTRRRFRDAVDAKRSKRPIRPRPSAHLAAKSASRSKPRSTSPSSGRASHAARARPARYSRNCASGTPNFATAYSSMYWWRTGTSRSSPTAARRPGFPRSSGKPRAGSWKSHFRAGRFEEGAVAGVEAVGGLLEREFPARAGDRDELPNQPDAPVAECRQPESSMRCHTLDMKTQSALRPLVVAALVSRWFPAARCSGDGPKWGAKRDAEKAAKPCRRCPSPCPRIASRSTPPPTSSASCRRPRATKEDTLTDIARRFNVGYEEIVRANPGVDPWLPGENREIVIPSQFILPNAPREGIVINAAAMRLFYYPKVKKGEPQVVHTYPIGIGKVGWKTPEGATKVVRRTKDPDLASDRVHHQGASRRARREARARGRRRGRTIRSAASRSTSAGPRT